MKSLDGRPKDGGPASLMKRRFMPCAIDHGVFNPASPKKHKLDRPPEFVNSPRSEKELNRWLDIPRQRGTIAREEEGGMFQLPRNIDKAIAVVQKLANTLHEILFVALLDNGFWLATRQDRAKFKVQHPMTVCLEVKPVYAR